MTLTKKNARELAEELKSLSRDRSSALSTSHSAVPFVLLLEAGIALERAAEVERERDMLRTQIGRVAENVVAMMGDAPDVAALKHQNLALIQFDEKSRERIASLEAQLAEAQERLRMLEADAERLGSASESAAKGRADFRDAFRNERAAANRWRSLCRFAIASESRQVALDFVNAEGEGDGEPFWEIATCGKALGSGKTPDEAIDAARRAEGSE